MRKLFLLSTLLLIALLLIRPLNSPAQYVVTGGGCGASGLSAIANDGTPVVCKGNPLVWTAIVAPTTGFTYTSSPVSPNLTIAGSSNTGPQLNLGFGNGGGASLQFGSTGPTITDSNGATISTSGPLSPTALLDSGAAAATLSGTGACATFSGQVGGKLAGSAACASATAASTLTISGLPAAAHGYVCGVQDETTRANLFQQTSHTTTSCVLTVTSVTQNDVFVFTAVGF